MRDEEKNEELEGTAGPREVGNCEGEVGKGNCLICGQTEMSRVMEKGLELAKDKGRNRKHMGQVHSLFRNLCWQISLAKHLSFPFKNPKLHRQNVKIIVCIAKPHNSNEVFVQS